MANISDLINTISGLRLIEGGLFSPVPGGKRVEFSGVISISKIEQLLHVLKENNQEFTLYDGRYPSPSGAYLSYSPEKSYPGTWSMTLGNDGWSGGIYQIEERTICYQLENLISRNLLSSIGLENVCFFSHYPMKEASENRETNQRLLEIHAKNKLPPAT